MSTTLARSLLAMTLFVLIIASTLAIQRDSERQTSKGQPLSASELVARLESKVAADVPNTQKLDQVFNGSVSLRAEGYDFRATAPATIAVEFGPKRPAMGQTIMDESQYATAQRKDMAVVAPIGGIAKKLLLQDGFDVEMSDTALPSINDGTTFVRSDLVCVMRETITVVLRCTDRAKINEEAAKVKNFADIYRVAATANPSELAFSVIEQGSGANPDAQYAIVGVGFAAAYFYTQDGSWQYLRTTQEGIDCSELPNQAAKDAITNCRQPGQGL